MTRTEYFFVFESIIYGIILTEFLGGVVRAIKARKTIKSYWAYYAFMGVFIALLLNNYTWQFYRNPFELVDSVFTFALFVMGYPISYYFIMKFAFPESFDNLDVKKFVQDNRREILWPVLVMEVYTFFIGSTDYVIYKGWGFYFDHITSWNCFQDLGMIFLFILLILLAMFHRKMWTYELLAVIAVIAQTAWSFMTFRSM